MNDKTAPLLDDLLRDELSFEATTRDGLTSHLPMAVIAKGSLGASRDELLHFANSYRRRLVPRASPTRSLTTATWHTAIGQAGAFDDLSDYFTRAVADDGVDAVVRHHLPSLLDGICGAAFHGAIRLAYALEDGASERIAAGLAYLAESAVPLVVAKDSSSSSRSVRDVFEELFKHRDELGTYDRPLISTEMEEATKRPPFRLAMTSVDVDHSTPEDLRQVALELFATTADFTSLHAVTGTAALATLRPYVEDTTAFDRATLIGVAAAYATVGSPALATTDELNERISRPRPPVDAIRHAGAFSTDEHVAKLVYSALRLHEQTGDDLYLYVAARKAGLVE